MTSNGVADADENAACSSRNARRRAAPRLAPDRDRLRGEVENWIRSIATGVPADTVAPYIRQHEMEIARLEARLRAPRREAPNLEELREALEQRAAEWRQTLRFEPKVARAATSPDWSARALRREHAARLHQGGRGGQDGTHRRLGGNT